jgi:hypothetical protein
MPQGAIALSVEPYQGGTTKLNCPAAAATLVKATAGRVMQINVNAANSVTGISIYDSATTAGTSAANCVFTSAAAVAQGTIIQVDFPVTNGIVIVTGTGGVCAVSYL